MDSMLRFKYLMNRDLENLDRVMVDYWASPEIDVRLIKYYGVKNKEELLDKLDIDFRYINGPDYLGPKLKVFDDGSENDIWGVPRKEVFYGEGEHRGSYRTVVRNPLIDIKSIEDIESYDFWPDPDWFDYSVISEQCNIVHESGRVVMFMGDRLNRFAQLKPMMYLSGIKGTLSDMARKNTPIFDAILKKIIDFYNEYLNRILKAANGKIDVVFTGDDFGQQDGLMCRPKMWRQKLYPGFKKYISICKQYGVYVAHHTCGSVTPIITDMIEAGLDILNPIQPMTYNMDQMMLKEKFGEDIFFHGGVSLQGALRFGNPKQVEQEVKICCKTLGKNGGYIICSAHNLNADMNTENIAALFEAYKKYCFLNK